ncbi:hypothetical protein HNR01_001787 [Methylorubrum rhodesianum]|uniref:hypothetical protein n=1 Tax=Methylorubrum rhodesianum TaxID=29427 RepID=UPI0017E2D9EF|nr:hypothetical protein [Methylorubrum rhodesianum]MBB5762167.1 hypothetical protein [Methylorubrum rhodesianum]
MTLAEMVEDLRADAEDLASDLDGVPAEETASGQAAQALEEFGDALARIRDGAPNPQDVARIALALSEPLKPIGNADDAVRELLKPRRE